jgi:hypothetical protein
VIIDLRDQIRAILEDPDIDELDQAVEALHSVMKATLDRLNGDVARHRDALGLAKANPAPGSSHRLRDKLRQAEAELAEVNAALTDLVYTVPEGAEGVRQAVAAYWDRIRLLAKAETERDRLTDQLRTIRTLQAMYAKLAEHGMPADRPVFARTAADLGKILDQQEPT